MFLIVEGPNKMSLRSVSQNNASKQRIDDEKRSKIRKMNLPPTIRNMSVPFPFRYLFTLLTTHGF